MASVVCVLVKICVSSISLYKLDTDKLTAPFESAHQFTLVCTVSDSKTVPSCHYNLCSTQEEGMLDVGQFPRGYIHAWFKASGCPFPPLKAQTGTRRPS